MTRQVVSKQGLYQSIKYPAQIQIEIISCLQASQLFYYLINMLQCVCVCVSMSSRPTVFQMCSLSLLSVSRPIIKHSYFKDSLEKGNVQFCHTIALTNVCISSFYFFCRPKKPPFPVKSELFLFLVEHCHMICDF